MTTKSRSLPSHIQQFLDNLQSEWGVPLRAVRPSSQGARFMAFQDGKDREYILHAIPGGPESALGIVEVDTSHRR